MTLPSPDPPSPLEVATHAAERALLHQLERLGARQVFGDTLELLASVGAWTCTEAAYVHLKRAARRPTEDGRP